MPLVRLLVLRSIVSVMLPVSLRKRFLGPVRWDYRAHERVDG
jgi:hypothetical protein